MVTTLDFAVDDREERRLDDGTHLRLRRVRPADKPLLVEGFQRLSPHSRYLRFFTHKRELSDDELRFFTEFDGWDHLALGVVRLNEQGEEAEGVAVARFVRLPEAAEVAEVALAVVDAMQGRGLGRWLLERLVLAAAQRRVACFRFYLLSENQRMRALLLGTGWPVRFQRLGDELVAEFSVAEVAAGLSRLAGGASLDELLCRVGAGWLSLPLSLSLATCRMWWRAEPGSAQAARARFSAGTRG
ncbi:MAG TPA: GNAT family N-acetyltransferase [Candidatus Competibacteraceae bacterium]|nr:GNAT family N-acetyltransferase [Candidatus Competibacteraceae bacterium]